MTLRYTLISVTALLTACSTFSPEEPAQMSEEFSVIEGHLAAKPPQADNLPAGGKRLILYIGDRHIEPTSTESVELEDAVTGETIETPVEKPVETQPKLTNIRKAVTENTEEKHILRGVASLLRDWDIGADGPTIRLYGRYIEKRWNEHVFGIDFVFCYIGYDDPITGDDQIIDTCFGDRWQDDFFRFIYEKGVDGVKKGVKTAL